MNSSHLLVYLFSQFFEKILRVLIFAIRYFLLISRELKFGILTKIREFNPCENLYI